MDDPQSQLLPLLLLVNCNIFNMPDASQSTQELSLDKDTPNADNTVGRFVDYNNGVVGARSVTHGRELSDPCGFTWVCDDSQNFKDRQMSSVVVCGGQRADLIDNVSEVYMQMNQLSHT